MTTVKYDWQTIFKDDRFTTISYDISEALNQENPRNVILNWHLFIEIELDLLLIQYYWDKMTNRKRTLFWNFLKSKHIGYFEKIAFLRMTEILIDNQVTSLISSEVYSSLKAIGAVRNAFHHNLNHEDALFSLSTGDKFMFIKNPQYKTLAAYKDVTALINDFKIEIFNLNEKLHNLSFLI